MNEFKEKYINLINVWINGNYVRFYVNDVFVPSIVDYVAIEDEVNLLLNEKLDNSDEFFPHGIVRIDKIESMDVYVDVKDTLVEEDYLSCLKIYKENNEWKHEIVLPKKSNT